MPNDGQSDMSGAASEADSLRSEPREQAAAEKFAARLDAQAPPEAVRTRTVLPALIEAGRIDRAVYRAVAETPSPTLDRPLRMLSQAANRSVLWMGIAAAMAAVGGRDGRRAAGVGLVAVAVDSAIVNAGIKRVARRRRPEREEAKLSADRQVRMPTSRSFPSGHTASAFAFADAVGQTLPAAAAPLRLLAGLVGYSRVHTGVHYPGDVIMGALIGASIGELVGWSAQRAASRRA